jgi:transposase
MREHQLLTDDQKLGIVEAYKRGDKIRDIERKFGVARATVYWTLEQAAVTPDRIQRGRRLVGDDQQLAQLYMLVESQHERLAELTEISQASIEMLGKLISQHAKELAQGRPLDADTSGAWAAAAERWEALEARLARLTDVEDQE